MGSRQNMLSVISGVVDVVAGCGEVVFRGGMIGVFFRLVGVYSFPFLEVDEVGV